MPTAKPGRPPQQLAQDASSKVREDFALERRVVLLMGMQAYPFKSMEIAQNLPGRKFDKPMCTGFRDDAFKLFYARITITN